ncbi:MAG TPA: DMT family transporter [Candidatus Xenobia bacterium]|jgi:drug/metabolite transporter (DMT)-like permease
MAATLVSAALFAVMGLWVKEAAAHLASPEIVFCRSLVPALLLLPYLWRARQGVRANGWLLLLRGALGGAAMMCYFWSIARIRYADANLLCNLSPLFTAFLAAGLLHEPLSRRVRYALPLALVGVYLIVRPAGASVFDIAGYGIGLLAGVLSGASCVAVRKLTQAVGPEVVVGAFSWVTVVMAAPVALSNWQWPGWTDTALLLGVALSATGAQLFMTVGYRELPAALAGTVGLVQVPMAAVLALSLLHEGIGLPQIVGMAVVLGAVGSLTAEGLPPLDVPAATAAQ